MIIEITRRDVAKYIIGILILLTFLAILGIYIFLLSRLNLGLNSNAAGLMLAGQEDVEKRLTDVQTEINSNLTKIKEVEPTPAKYLKISKFTASQSVAQSGSQVIFSYAAENTSRGVSYRLLLQCPTGVTATYSNGTNVCRQSIADALPIDNSGAYTVNLANNSSEPRVIIAVLLASDITDNAIFFRDSRVLTVTVMPSGNSNYVSSTGDVAISFYATPSGAPAPADISFTATLNDLSSCLQSHWDFGDGISSESFPICPNNNTNIRARTLVETHRYSQPGTYVASLYAGGRKVSTTIYVSAATTYYTSPYQYSYYTPTYTYSVPSQPVYNYVYTPAPVYNITVPSLPDVPTVPINFRAVSSGSNAIVLNWSAPTYGNVVNYTIYRKGGSSLATPIAGSPTVCSSNSANVCYYTVSGSLTSFTDTNVAAGNVYTYRIVASNGYGTSDFSDSLTISLAESNSPTVPRTFTATVSGGKIILNWSAPTSGSVSSYTIYRKGGNSLPVPITISSHACNSGALELCYYYVSGQTYTLTDVNLYPNTAYTYRIIAVNAYGSSEFSDSLTVISGQAEPPVSTPTLNPVNRVDQLNMTQLTWSSVGASYYRVYRSANRGDVTPSGEELANCTTGTTNPCFVAVSGNSAIYGLQATDSQYDTTKTYYYRVRAYGVSGASNWSNEVTSIANTIITPPVVLDPIITSFTVDGQPAPTVSSGSIVSLYYSGSNVASYKLFLQCPANVSVPDRATGANMCRTNQDDAVSIGNSGVYQMAIYNMNAGNQNVAATIMAFRSNGTLSNAVTRTITVRPQPGF